MCQQARCTHAAVYEFKPRGAGRAKYVCSTDLCVLWAKGELADDFPGYAIERASLDDESVQTTYY